MLESIYCQIGYGRMIEKDVYAQETIQVNRLLEMSVH